MNGYVRPTVDAPVFRDADGAVIEYGRRWPGSPPEETYSVDTHPERFAPLHAVGDALVAHLRTAYDVVVDEGVAVAGDLNRPSFSDVLRAVRLRPTDPRCAAVTVVFDAYPGISVHSGLLHDARYPHCGCDACDEEWEAVATDLEQHVFAVVTGNFREAIVPGAELPVRHAFTFPEGGRSGESRADGFPPERVSKAREVLRDLPDGWAPWPRAQASPGGSA
ncbi:hypothetical protein C3481_00620 [Microbacterium sp. Ru50]|uniref:DUF6226 family protein n=1 Tax=Microbacterium sp. Ru50 TaxID=2080744 RepID=UPI000CDE50BD|nr:DUF6226 family protein [Microbacterium sp. Ru50]POX66817.1 hypothetical protein C3481_00620 [Microbacterium sp. Ru50]